MDNPAFKVHGFSDSEALTKRIARLIRAPWAEVQEHSFPDGESLVRVATPPGVCAILVRSFPNPDSKLIETVLAIDALRRAGSRRVVLVAPYLPYMRQDKVFRAGEPISQRVIAELLGHNLSRLITINPHLHRTHSLGDVFRCAATSLSAAPAIAGWVTRNARPDYVIGPDEESGVLVKAVAQMAKAKWAAGKKHRSGDRTVHIEFPRLTIAKPSVLLVDDIASSGATLAVAARTLSASGARIIGAAVVHPIFERGAISRMRQAGIRTVVSCDTIVHPTNAIEIAPLIARALKVRK